MEQAHNENVPIPRLYPDWATREEITTRTKEETNGEVMRRVHIEISKVSNNTDHKEPPSLPQIEDTPEIIPPNIPTLRRGPTQTAKKDVDYSGIYSGLMGGKFTSDIAQNYCDYISTLDFD